MRTRVPESLKKEHEELHAELLAATKAPGTIGEAAREVAKVLHPHFVKEEEFALPPLGLLAPLVHAAPSAEIERVVAMTDRLKAELPVMLAEHQQIVAALERLRHAAGSAGEQRWEQFAEKLILHARTEEEVMYPAAILVGEWVKTQGAKQRGKIAAA